MLELPNHILAKLQCAKCGGYLSCDPLVVNKANEQLCGRCFKILPDEIKSSCVRQIGLEAVAEILIFPCKYNQQGCSHTFPFNKGNTHEINCKYRNDSLSSYSNEEQIYQFSEIEMKVHCGNMYNLDGEDKLKLNIEVSGKSTAKLLLDDEKVRLNLELVVGLNPTPKVTYSHAFTEKLEPIYDTVPYNMLPHRIGCATCHKSIVQNEIFHCPYGHSLCKTCKNKTCNICGILPNSKSRHYCKNFINGCTDLFLTSELNKHEIDCEFNDYKCDLCSYVDFMSNLITHFVSKHKVIESNELNVCLNKKDQEWYFHCHGKLFRCRYYNLEEVVEFVVSYVGSNDNAKKYKYEVNLLELNMKKNTSCLGWNEVALGTGLSFELGYNLRKNLRVKIIILHFQ